MTPAAGTIEAWALELIETCDLRAKLEPVAAPDDFAAGFEALRIGGPGRPPELEVVARAAKAPKPGALIRPHARAQLLHTFAHHELQAAELFCWGLLAFPHTPPEFRRGLLSLALEELRHARLYCAQLERLGFAFGDFAVRDWFWQRFLTCESELQFVALMGLGFEGGNLDHAELWAQRFDEVGDHDGARCQRVIGKDEIAHVRFAARWFREWAGELSFDSFRAHLPAPLTPMLMRGKQLNREARLEAGLDLAFLEDFEAWTAATSGT